MLQPSLLNPCVEGRPPSSSPVHPIQRPSRVSSLCPALGVTALAGEPWILGLLSTAAHLALGQPSAGSTIRFHDPACVTSKSTQLPKGRLLPNPCPPLGSTSNPAQTAGAPRALHGEPAPNSALRVQRCSSATNQAWKPENPSLIKRLKSQKPKENHCFNGRRHRV